jgi:hypothetical protein
MLANLSEIPQSKYDLKALTLTDEAKQQLELGKIFSAFLNVIYDLDDGFNKIKAPKSANTILANSAIALGLLRTTLVLAGKFGRRPSWSIGLDLDYQPLPAGLEALILELGEVISGKKSDLFLPSASDGNMPVVRPSVRAAAAAALHVLIELKILPAEQAATLISEYLFAQWICRVDHETHERHPIPADTVQDWRKRREKQTTQFRDFFANSVKFISVRVGYKPKDMTSDEAFSNRDITLDVTETPLLPPSPFLQFPLYLPARLRGGNLSGADRRVITVLDSINTLLRII